MKLFPGYEFTVKKYRDVGLLFTLNYWLLETIVINSITISSFSIMISILGIIIFFVSFVFILHIINFSDSGLCPYMGISRDLLEK